MNPYNFVSVNWNRLPQGRKPAQHHKFVGVSGSIQGTITAETPIFIRDPHQNMKPLSFIRNKRQNYIIPNTSLKGLFRSLVETVGQGCFSLFDGDYTERSWPTDARYRLPRGFERCNHPDKLCVACRMFGTLVGTRESQTRKAFHHKGHVSVDDAVLTHLENHDHVYLPPLFKPRSYHKDWYVQNGNIAGRKFYYHQPDPYYLFTRPDKQSRREQIKPLGVGTTFEFRLNFQNLNEADELPFLLYAITLEDSMRHKIGYGKPAGLGTIHIKLTEIKLIDYQSRYINPENGTQRIQGEQQINQFVSQKTNSLRNNQSPTFQDLRHVWQWPALEPPTGFGYPTRHWFDNNKGESIKQSWDAPRQQ